MSLFIVNYNDELDKLSVKCMEIQKKKFKELNHALHCIPESLYTELKTLHLSLGLNWVFLKKKKRSTKVNVKRCLRTHKTFLSLDNFL